jgi:hypothetical protein
MLMSKIIASPRWPCKLCKCGYFQHFHVLTWNKAYCNFPNPDGLSLKQQTQAYLK